MKKYEITIKAKDYDFENVKFTETYEANNRLEAQTMAYDHAKTMMLHRVEIINVARVL